jgi:hypothetical protein
VPVRVSPTERIHAEIDALFDRDRDLGEVIKDVAQLGARLISQTALEAEVEVFLGRARYQRAAGVEGAAAGLRNGYCPATVKTTAGPVTVERPKLGETSCLSLVCRAGPRQPRHEHHQYRATPAPRSARSAPRPAHPAPPNQPAARRARRHCQRRRLTSQAKEPRPRHLHRSRDATSTCGPRSRS